jgi:hypothetical protein
MAAPDYFPLFSSHTIDCRHDLAQMQAEMERIEAEMAEMKRQHAAEVQSLKEEGVRRGTEASLASDRREVQLRSQIMDAAQKARKHIFEHQMAESKISGGASPSITLAGHDKTLAEESKEAHDALEREREAAQLSSLTLWMMTTGRKAASFISATGEFPGIPHLLSGSAKKIIPDPASKLNPIVLPLPHATRFRAIHLAHAYFPLSCKQMCSKSVCAPG